MPSSSASRVRGVRSIYRNQWFQVLERDVAGFADPYYVVSAADYVTVLPMSVEGDVVFVRQYRPAVDSITLELPSGHIDEGEQPEQAAVREVLEETGCETLELIPLGGLASNTGRMDNRLWAFVAKVNRIGEPEAGIDLEWFPSKEIARMVRESRLLHALDLAVLMKAASAGYVSIAPEVGAE